MKYSHYVQPEMSLYLSAQVTLGGVYIFCCWLFQCFFYKQNNIHRNVNIENLIHFYQCSYFLKDVNAEQVFDLLQKDIRLIFKQQK